MKRIIFTVFKYVYTEKQNFKEQRRISETNYCDQISSTGVLQNEGYKFPKNYRINRYINFLPMSKEGRNYLLISTWKQIKGSVYSYPEQYYFEPIQIYVNKVLCNDDNAYLYEIKRLTQK